MYKEQTFWNQLFLLKREWRNIFFWLNNKYCMEQTIPVNIIIQQILFQ